MFGLSTELITKGKLATIKRFEATEAESESESEWEESSDLVQTDLTKKWLKVTMFSILNQSGKEIRNELCA